MTNDVGGTYESGSVFLVFRTLLLTSMEASTLLGSVPRLSSFLAAPRFRLANGARIWDLVWFRPCLHTVVTHYNVRQGAIEIPARVFPSTDYAGMVMERLSDR